MNRRDFLKTTFIFTAGGLFLPKMGILRPLEALAGMRRVTGCQLRISNVSGYRFLWDTVNNLAVLSRQNDTLKIYDSSNRLLEVVVTGNGTGETLGSELFADIGFDSDAAWTKGAGWTVAGSQAVATNVISGLYIGQWLLQTTGVLYRAKYDIKTITEGTVSFGWQAVLGAIYAAAADNITDTFTGTSTASLLAGLRQRGGAAAEMSGTFDNISLKQVLTPSTTGILFRQVSVASGFDYNSTYTVDIIHRGGRLPRPIPSFVK